MQSYVRFLISDEGLPSHSIAGCSKLLCPPFFRLPTPQHPLLVVVRGLGDLPRRHEALPRLPGIVSPDILSPNPLSFPSVSSPRSPSQKPHTRTSKSMIQTVCFPTHFPASLFSGCSIPRPTTNGSPLLPSFPPRFCDPVHLALHALASACYCPYVLGSSVESSGKHTRPSPVIFGSPQDFGGPGFDNVCIEDMDGSPFPALRGFRLRPDQYDRFPGGCVRRNHTDAPRVPTTVQLIDIMSRNNQYSVDPRFQVCVWVCVGVGVCVCVCVCVCVHNCWCESMRRLSCRVGMGSIWYQYCGFRREPQSGALAQLVERALSMREARGSKP